MGYKSAPRRQNAGLSTDRRRAGVEDSRGGLENDGEGDTVLAGSGDSPPVAMRGFIAGKKRLRPGGGVIRKCPKNVTPEL
jgi:hypothetical protein